MKLGLRAGEGSSWFGWPPWWKTRPVKRLDKSAMVTLLQTYETAITELKGLRDPSVAEFLRRMERHRAEAFAALTRQTGRVDPG